MRYTTLRGRPAAGHPAAGRERLGRPAGGNDNQPGGDDHRGNPAQCADTPGQAVDTFSAAITSGAVTTAKITYGDCNLSAADKATLARLPANGRAYTEKLYSLDADYRLMAKPGDNGTILITGLPLSSVTDTLHKVELTEIIVFAAALLLTGFIGTGWVRLSLRPLRRMTATAAEVARLPLASEVDLPHRVPDADPRTEVGQLGAAFNRMLGHVEDALARRHASESRLRRFAADASHELRTPLAAIRGYAELARRHPGPAAARGGARPGPGRVGVGPDERAGRGPAAAGPAGRRAARWNPQPVDLTRLAHRRHQRRARRRARSPVAARAARGSRCRCSGDDQRLHQVLANLLSNARTHTPAGTTVTVAVSRTADGRTAELSVTDDGPGIPAELQPGLFERFVRGDSSRSRAAGSTGLGLSIVAAVIAAHRGTVGVTSEPGRTRFLITLPLLPADAEAPARS